MLQLHFKKIKGLASSERLDTFLLRQARDLKIPLSRSQLKTYFQKKEVLLNGKPCKASTLLTSSYQHATPNSSDSLPRMIIEIPFKHGETSSSDISFESRDGPKVLFENDDFFILDKPSGLHSSRLGESTRNSALLHQKDTAMDWAIELSPGLKTLGTQKEYGLLHRLDQQTSGILAFAKTRLLYDELRLLWSSGLVRKNYRALVQIEDLSRPLPFLIRDLICHSAKSKKKMLLFDPRKKTQFRGKPQEAITQILKVHHYELFSIQASRLHVLDLEVQILTGVLHQIRCHLSGTGFPILGDPIYLKKSIRDLLSQSKFSKRLWLHSAHLKIPPTSQSQAISLESPLPKNWLFRDLP